jgi:iron complex outermembrane receptor protein
VGETTFNSGLVWKVDGLDTLRLMVSRGALLPNLVELGAFVAQSPTGNISGVPTLNPTIVTNYEADWDRSIPALNALFRAAAFYEKTTSIFDVVGGFVDDSSGPYITPTNIGDSRADGIELSLKGTFAEHWRWGLGYRFEALKDLFNSADQDGDVFVAYQRTTPQSLANANIGWSKARWEIDGYLRYESATQGLLPLPDMTNTGFTPIPAYVSLDARVAYKPISRMTLAVSGQDISRATQRQTSAQEVPRQVFGSVTVDF